MKKKLFAAALLILMISIVGYGTYAYYTVEGTATNVITSGGINITLKEEFPEGGVFGVVPGVTETKKVWVTNDGPDTAWIRVKVDTVITLADKTEGDPSHVSMDFNTSDWEYRDGYWYYQHKVPYPGKTAELFTEVTFSTEMDNRYQNSVAQVNVYAEATQVAHNGDTVWEAKGWPNSQKGEVN